MLSREGLHRLRSCFWGILPGQEMSLWPTICWGSSCGGLPSAGTIQPRGCPHGCFLRVITASNPQVRTRPVTAGERADAPLLAAYGVRKWSGSLRFCNSR